MGRQNNQELLLSLGGRVFYFKERGLGLVEHVIILLVKR